MNGSVWLVFAALALTVGLVAIGVAGVRAWRRRRHERLARERVDRRARFARVILSDLDNCEKWLAGARGDLE